ncbi:MAG: hypothetical protein FJ087_14270 [Deltaproteobacteria bacterium]|nr:hypothetical protein [Deltaproteobacteria bacterium]
MSLPSQSRASSRRAGDVTVLDADRVVFPEKAFPKPERVRNDRARSSPFPFRNFVRTLPSWRSGRLGLPPKLLADPGFRGSTPFVRHHLGFN